MKPVVQKIRVGDVLLGTKNLRNYLRTCSMLRYFRALDRKHGPKGDPKSLLYTPNKQDQFIVSVDNHGRFAVWGPNKNVVLLFVNRSQAGIEHYSLSKDITMDSNIFAQWFVRTQGRKPAVKAWPAHAHYLWASIHMNAWRNPKTQLRMHSCRTEHTEDGPFEFANGLGVDNCDRQTIALAVRESVMRGVFRNFPNNKERTPQLFSDEGFGPRLQDLPNLRLTLESMMGNPRLVSKAKQDKKIDFAFLMNVQKNPQ